MQFTFKWGKWYVNKQKYKSYFPSSDAEDETESAAQVAR